MNQKNSPLKIIVIRPRPRFEDGRTDVLFLDVENCEELVHRHACPGSTPWFKALIPMIQNVLGSGVSMVAMDLREVTYVNSTSLGEMVDLFKDIESNGGKLVLVNPSPRVKNIFEVTQLDRIFMVLDSMDNGTKYLRTGQMPQI